MFWTLHKDGLEVFLRIRGRDKERNMTHKRKIITFICAMISLTGLIGAVVVNHGFENQVTYEYWFYWSVPLIINLIHYAVFREEKKVD